VEAMDKTADHDFDIWSGVLKLETQPATMVTNLDCKSRLPVPSSIKQFEFTNNSVKS
jgi:hypothetical protein